MVDAADPRDDALEPHSEPGMRKGPVAAHVEVPLVGLARQLVLLEPPLEQREIVDAVPVVSLTAASIRL
jgi:hypothetical protein